MEARSGKASNAMPGMMDRFDCQFVMFLCALALGSKWL